MSPISKSRQDQVQIHSNFELIRHTDEKLSQMEVAKAAGNEKPLCRGESCACVSLLL